MCLWASEWRDSEIDSKDFFLTISVDKSECYKFFLLSTFLSQDTVKKVKNPDVDLSVELSLTAQN